MTKLNLSCIAPDWRPLVEVALKQVNPLYLKELEQTDNWLPGSQNIFNAFSLPLAQTRYILLGESPYPRKQSANGFAFWDQAVTCLWSEQGLSKTVNRATSLRNFMKMLLVAHGLLVSNETSQSSIASVPKQGLINTASDLFGNMQKQGILLLNASLVLSEHPVKYDAKAWLGFMQSLLQQTEITCCDIQLILFGKIAELIPRLCPAWEKKSFIAEHPYNISFIKNRTVQDFFQPMNLIYPLIT
ncbi:MAG: uracil-DNA glycosylase [Legionellales bacterium]|nr:uracil-DNA glycosylase [Legionellales bacterium]